MSKSKDKLTFVDLFSGIGGFRIALESLNAKCVFSSEIDRWARETYVTNFGDVPAGDITKINSSEIPDHDILCAGFPCQAFSIGGHRKGFEDTRGTLFFDVARILDGRKPDGFILENVRGILSHDHGKTIETIRKTLDSLGYHFFEQVINAKDHGLPQNRERWFCVGFKKELEVESFDFPQPVKLTTTVSDHLEKRVSGHEMTKIAAMHVKRHYREFSRRSGAGGMTLAYEIRPSRCGMRNDGLAPCLTAKMGTGGNNVPVAVNLNRKLTVRECLRLMGFPDTFRIRENNHQSYKQIGNSVPVPVVEKMGREVIAVLQKSLGLDNYSKITMASA